MDKQKSTPAVSGAPLEGGKTAGETAKRTLVIFRDCHKRNNIVVPIESGYEERFYKNFARRMGWKWCIRKASVEAALRQAQGPQAEYNWRKPAAAVERPKLADARRLLASALATKGGAR